MADHSEVSFDIQEMQKQIAVTVTYTNHRGETAQRRILPSLMYWGRNQYHPEDQWLMNVFDIERGVHRTFALAHVVWPVPHDTAAPAPLPLFMVTDHDRWGYSQNVVRAASPEQAVALVCPESRLERVEVEALASGNVPAILWCHDESPDTGRD